MPRYYFHLNDGREDPDLDGLDLPSTEAARIAAVRFAGELLQERDDEFRPGADWRVNVTDSTGLILFTLDIGMSHSAAVGEQIPSPNAARS